MLLYGLWSNAEGCFIYPIWFLMCFWSDFGSEFFFSFDCISWFPGTACFHLHLIVFLNLLLRACLDIALQPLLILMGYCILHRLQWLHHHFSNDHIISMVGSFGFLFKWRNCLWPVLGWNLEFCCLTNLLLHYLVPLMSLLVYIHTFVFGQ